MTEKQPTQVEAEQDEFVTVGYKGKNYVFPASLDDADGDVIDAVDDQKLSHALRGLLSEEQWESFKSTKPKVRHYGELFEAYAKKIGLESAGK